jgi:hypothetical protein
MLEAYPLWLKSKMYSLAFGDPRTVKQILEELSDQDATWQEIEEGRKGQGEGKFHENSSEVRLGQKWYPQGVMRT